ncbi:isopentenyl-diphosphate Delta-isomerase [Patescibacteria group bacterium]|nr:isopentenyl-diphosphate Delta-isomerase [Patescibacteria group bacterium]
MDEVILVNAKDEELGLMEKLEAHQNSGQLHRAISVLLYRDGQRGKEVLLQKRSRHKLLWPLFWSNTCCTHPRDGEGYVSCGVRRLKEELGITISHDALKTLYRFEYRVRYSDGLGEHELDSVIVGEYSGSARPNPEEVAEVGWIGWRELVRGIVQHPESYAPWFWMIVEREEVKQLFEEGNGRSL